MAYFTQDFIDFFSELEQNNNKAWFDENRKHYEKTIKEPVKAFVKDLITEVQKDDSDIILEPKDCIFRINRDIRFSKDKTPYKTHSSAAIAKGGRKDHTNPGLYIQFNHQDIRIYSGIFGLDKNQLESVRDYIMDYSDELDKLLNDKKFVNTFGNLLGDKNKRINKFYHEAAESQPLLFNKSFYYYKSFNPQLLLKDNLIEVIMESYRTSYGVKSFFENALDTN